jgi:hypothetical protein
VFVPCFFVIFQRLEEWLAQRKSRPATGAA